MKRPNAGNVSLVLDSDVLIDLQRGFPNAVVWFASLAERPKVPGFVEMELIQASKNGEEVRASRGLLLTMVQVWPSEKACEQAVEVYARLHLSHRLGLIDALIAATAVSLDEPLAIHNAKHYAAYPGLVIVRPYAK